MKCTTSPNDMEMDTFQGIPDTYDGRVLSKKCTLTQALPFTPSATLDSFILLLPTPGVAFWYAQTNPAIPAANFTLTPVYYDGFGTLFPPGLEDTVVDEFRLASNVIEIVPTVNSMTWAGAIEVFKGPVSMSPYDDTGSGAIGLKVVGLEAMLTVKPQSVMPFNHGCYAVTAPLSDTYPFIPIAKALTSADVYAGTGVGGAVVTFGGGQNLIGFGTQEAVFIKLPAGTSTTSNTAIVRTWSCVEYQLNSHSAFYDFASQSPCHDPIALALVREFIHTHPTAVPYYDNASFWSNFLAWVGTVSGALKVVPGLVGEVAGITNLVAKTASLYVK